VKRGRGRGWQIGHLFSPRTKVPEAVREWVEDRVQVATEQAYAAHAAAIEPLLNALRESSEQRIQIGTWQAMSHADQGISAMAAALKGVAKTLATFKRQVEVASFVKQEDMTAIAAVIEAELEELRSALGKGFGGRSRLSGGKGRVDGDDIEKSGQTGRIINLEKVNKMRVSGLRLNIGCGHIKHDDYINVDMRERPGIDIVSEPTGIPIETGEVAEIVSTNLIEHFTAHTLDHVLLPYWKSLLKSGGHLITVAPDGAAMLCAVNSGAMSFEDFREVLFGGKDSGDDFHRNLITPDSYRNALHRAGFVDIEMLYSEKKNGKRFEFKAVARKP